MISDGVRKKRQIAYELARRNSESRGAPLTQESEKIMKKYINGEISDQEFFDHITRVAEKELMPPIHFQ